MFYIIGSPEFMAHVHMMKAQVSNCSSEKQAVFEKVCTSICIKLYSEKDKELKLFEIKAFNNLPCSQITYAII